MGATGARARDGGIMVGIGAGLMLIALLVLQSLIGGGLLGTTTVTHTATTASPSTPTEQYDQVASVHANRLLLLGARNVSALLSGYEGNATVEWTGQVAGLGGNYTGTNAIGILLGHFPGEMVNLTLSEESQTIGQEGDHWVVNSTFSWAGYSPYDGSISGMIASRDSYVSAGGAWLVAGETWTWIAFNCQFPACRAP